jgi:hypothetical protein
MKVHHATHFELHPRQKRAWVPYWLWLWLTEAIVVHYVGHEKNEDK